jgi:subtilisin family serine protease
MAKRMNAAPWQGAWQAFLLLVLGTLAAFESASSLAGAAARGPREKIASELWEQVAAGGETAFWVLLHEKAELAPAYNMANDERGMFVYRELTRVAENSQAELRAFLDSRAARYQAFWIVNAIRVTGNEGMLLDIAARPDVREIQAEDSYEIQPPQPVRREPHGSGPEWGLDLIGALKVWDELSVFGAGIVVANVDTGVQYDHPALVNQYRGNLGGGNFDHNYNWYDPTLVCGNPPAVPCDNVGTGTHTMGTMVGEDEPNQIGVAPQAKWIAVKGCETTNCQTQALLKAGQWILAPRDLSGRNADPGRRPDAVTISWGVRGKNTFYQNIILSWEASGIFPAVANGDRGPACGTSTSPGDYFKSYSSGAFDINSQIATFSSRGPSRLGGFPKPNVGSPGVDIRSSFSIPPNSYASLNGTAMGSAHVAGTVALMWSYTPGIRRQVGTTRHLLDNTAFNQPPDACGGVPDKNNAWGDGRLNAWNAVRTSPNP